MLIPPSCRLLSLALRGPDAKGRMDGPFARDSADRDGQPGTRDPDRAS